MLKKIIPIILCGGKGSRLWPLSDHQLPKQFLKILSKKSLLQETIGRISQSHLFAKPLIIASLAHREILEKQLAEINCLPQKILYEPVGRNTGPAITTALLYLKETLRQKDSVVVVMPIDHEFSDYRQLIRAFKELLRKKVWEKSIISFGIKPKRAETQYGYIQTKGSVAKGINQVAGFVEKPNCSAAEKLLQEGNSLWNSGIYWGKLSTLLNSIAQYCPQELLLPCQVALREAMQAAPANSKHLVLAEGSFKSISNISIDKAVMEKANNLLVKELNLGWEDLGNWESFKQLIMRSLPDLDQSKLIGTPSMPPSSLALKISWNDVTVTLCRDQAGEVRLGLVA